MGILGFVFEEDRADRDERVVHHVQLKDQWDELETTQDKWF